MFSIVKLLIQSCVSDLLYQIWPWDKSISICLSKIIHSLMFSIEIFPAPNIFWILIQELNTLLCSFLLHSHWDRVERPCYTVGADIFYFGLFSSWPQMGVPLEYMRKSNISCCMRKAIFISNFSQAHNCQLPFPLCVRINVYLELRNPTWHLIWLGRDSDFELEALHHMCFYLTTLIP